MRKRESKVAKEEEQNCTKSQPLPSVGELWRLMYYVVYIHTIRERGRTTPYHALYAVQCDAMQMLLHQPNIFKTVQYHRDKSSPTPPNQIPSLLIISPLLSFPTSDHSQPYTDSIQSIPNGTTSSDSYAHSSSPSAQRALLGRRLRRARATDVHSSVSCSR